VLSLAQPLAEILERLGVDANDAALGPLAAENCDRSQVEVDVLDSQCEGLGDAQSGTPEQDH